jgi:hypothetical protein
MLNPGDFKVHVSSGGQEFDVYFRDSTGKAEDIAQSVTVGGRRYSVEANSAEGRNWIDQKIPKLASENLTIEILKERLKVLPPEKIDWTFDDKFWHSNLER